MTPSKLAIVAKLPRARPSRGPNDSRGASALVRKPPVLHTPVPGTDKLLEVEAIIRAATWNGEAPISLNGIKRRMNIANPRHSQVRDLVEVLDYLGRIIQTDKGVVYAYMDPAAAERLGHVKLTD